jgi:hypothetical protein
MKSSELAQDRRVHVLVIVVVAAWMVAVVTGRRLPYLETVFSQQLRGLVIFPGLLALLGWFAFVHKWAEYEQTGYRVAMASIASRSARLKQIGLAVAGALLISAMVAWSSVAFPAWSTQLLAQKPVAMKARVLEIKHASGGYTFQVWDQVRAEESSLFVSWSAYDRKPWREGDEICLQGRTWPFGTVIDSLSLVQDGCA